MPSRKSPIMVFFEPLVQTAFKNTIIVDSRSMLKPNCFLKVDVGGFCKIERLDTAGHGKWKQ